MTAGTDELSLSAETPPGGGDSITMAAVPKLYRIRLPRDVARSYDRDRDAGHRFVVRLLPDNLGREVRRDTGTLWRIDEGSDLLEILTSATISGLTGEDVPTLEAGQKMTLRVVLEAVQAKSSPVDPVVAAALHAEGIHWRSRRSRIPDAELLAWVDSQLSKHGWKVDAVTKLHRRTVSRRNSPMHLVECEAAVVVTDAETTSSALRIGVGRGRSFGAAMVTQL